MSKNIFYRLIRKIYYMIPISEEKRKKMYRTRKGKEMKEKILTKETFIDSIIDNDVISFDIFDTLLCRTLVSPDDIFLLMENKIEIKLPDSYLNMRKKSENEARETYAKDVNIDDIYESMKKLYPELKKDIIKWKDLEIELELQLCVPKLEMLSVFNTLKEKGKTVIFTSDMYLPKIVIEKLLNKCGYKNYDNLYVSCELNKRKDTESIWPFLQKTYKNMRIVHIGDNEKSDFINPKKYGIKAIKIKSGFDILKETEYYQQLKPFFDNRSISDSLLLGMLFNKKIFNSPFKVPSLETLNEFGYLLIGPVIDVYLKELGNYTKDKKDLCFLAREGYYLQNLYHEYCSINAIKEKKAHYFYASRFATFKTLLDQKDNFKVFLESQEFEGQISVFCQKLLNINYTGEDFVIKLPDDKDIVFETLQNSLKEIKKETKHQKDLYTKYIEAELGNLMDNSLIIDLGYSGTIQYNLSNMLKKDLDGYYLVNSDKVKKYSKKSKVNFTFDIKDNQNYHRIFEYSLLIEYLLSAPHGQLDSFESIGKKVKPVFKDYENNNAKETNMKKLYEAVLEYFKDIKTINDIYPIETNKALICANLTSIIESHMTSYNLKNEFYFTDDFNLKEYNAFERISKY